MAEQIALDRLTQERKNWRKDHPPGFYARPCKSGDTLNMFEWEFGIPGKKGTDWEEGLYTGTLKFKKDFPFSPPLIYFKPVIYHPNVYDDGRVCVSFLSSWNPSFSLKQMAVGLQDLLETPNPDSPANPTAARLFKSNAKKYGERIKKQASERNPDAGQKTVTSSVNPDVIVL